MDEADIIPLLSRRYSSIRNENHGQSVEPAGLHVKDSGQ